MKTWKGRTEDGSFAVELQASVLEALDRYCRDAACVETGGILIGRYSDDLALAIVREATPPPTDSKRGSSWFVRGVSGLREMLGKRWRANERTFYIGEWHFHPADHVEPSGDDFAQMIEIGRAKGYDCKEPLLVILGATKEEGQRNFRAFVCPAEDVPMELVRECQVNHDLDSGQLEAEFVLYEADDGGTRVEVRLDGDMAWFSLGRPVPARQVR